MKTLPAVTRLRDEMASRIKGGMNPSQAAEEAVAAVKSDFVAQAGTIDWNTLLPMLIQLMTVLLPLFLPPTPPAPHAASKG